MLLILTDTQYLISALHFQAHIHQEDKFEQEYSLVDSNRVGMRPPIDRDGTADFVLMMHSMK